MPRLQENRTRRFTTPGMELLFIGLSRACISAATARRAAALGVRRNERVSWHSSTHSISCPMPTRLTRSPWIGPRKYSVVISSWPWWRRVAPACVMPKRRSTASGRANAVSCRAARHTPQTAGIRVNLTAVASKDRSLFDHLRPLLRRRDDRAAEVPETPLYGARRPPERTH